MIRLKKIGLFFSLITISNFSFANDAMELGKIANEDTIKVMESLESYCSSMKTCTNKGHLESIQALKEKIVNAKKYLEGSSTDQFSKSKLIKNILADYTTKTVVVYGEWEYYFQFNYSEITEEVSLNIYHTWVKYGKRDYELYQRYSFNEDNLTLEGKNSYKLRLESFTRYRYPHQFMLEFDQDKLIIHGIVNGNTSKTEHDYKESTSINVN